MIAARRRSATNAAFGTGPLSAVIFEPYGTLLDIETDERDWYAYLNLSRFLEYRGVRLSADELRWLWFEKLARQTTDGAGPFAEISAQDAWREILEEHGDPCRTQDGLHAPTFITDVVSLHRALTRRTLRLMDGARRVLEALAGRVQLGVITDSQPEYILPELQLTGIRPLFDAVTVSGGFRQRKPAIGLFEVGLGALGIAPERAVFVGVDTGRDVAGAAAAGMRTVLVLTPYGSKDIALGEPDGVIDTIADLLPLLKPHLPPR